MTNQGKKGPLTYGERLKQDLKEPRPMPSEWPESYREIWDLGEAGKLWALEIVYRLDGNPLTQRKLLRNLTEPKLVETRIRMFSQGLGIAVDGDPGHWKIILPMDIISVDLYQQFGYFSG